MSEALHQSETATDPQLADSPVLQGERVAFTGTLAAMTHREAFEWVEKTGGKATQNVSRKTTLLVVGEEGWALEPDGKASKKLRQVLAWNLDDGDCRIMREPDWLHLIGANDRRPEVQREYTPAMLSRLLNVPVNRIRRWESIGLLRATRTVGRLPLFDYREVTGARRIVELLDNGVGERSLQRSVAALRAILPENADSVSTMPVESRGAKVLYRDDIGLLEPATGQRCFEFEAKQPEADDDSDSMRLPIAEANGSSNGHPQRSAEEWKREGDRLLEANQPREAAEAFRLALMDRPECATTQFQLAECLYRMGNRSGAIERYYTAVERDHEFVEAWTQLGCVLAEMDDQPAALDAFRIALQIHPENADAHWHTADLLWRRDRKSQSKPHWEAYLQHDADGPWAQTARQRLDDIDSETITTSETPGDS